LSPLVLQFCANLDFDRAAILEDHNEMDCSVSASWIISTINYFVDRQEPLKFCGQLVLLITITHDTSSATYVLNFCQVDFGKFVKKSCVSFHPTHNARA
jgi:hypothetical protein